MLNETDETTRLAMEKALEYVDNYNKQKLAAIAEYNDAFYGALEKNVEEIDLRVKL
jgi:hypothetical protein